MGAGVTHSLSVILRAFFQHREELLHQKRGTLTAQTAMTSVNTTLPSTCYDTAGQNREVFINNLTSTYLAKHTYSTAHRPFDQGFDLLDPTHDSKRLEDLPKVSLMEDEGGNIHLRNLSLYLAANEEEALNYLFLGDTNRAISETAMNKASSRSHCIFTVRATGHMSEEMKHFCVDVSKYRINLLVSLLSWQYVSVRSSSDGPE